jgi:hypothetical protein
MIPWLKPQGMDVPNQPQRGDQSDTLGFQSQEKKDGQRPDTSSERGGASPEGPA